MKSNIVLSAMLLASSAFAAPLSEARRQMRERRLAKRNARSFTPPLAVNFTSLQDVVVINQSTNAEYDSNWAGAVIVGDDITRVAGTANMPGASVPSDGNDDEQYGGSVWVGIDGDTCDTAILQTGVDWLVYGDEVVYQAWYEWYPASSDYFDDFDVSAGDEVTMLVVADSLTSGVAYLTNTATGSTVKKEFTDQPSLCKQNAEWIVEDFEEGDSLIPFAKFDSIKITDASYDAGGETYGVSSATIVDIEQSDRVLTDCSTPSDSEVSCTYV